MINKLTQLVLDEISAVDEGAHELDGWLVAKARHDQRANDGSGRFTPKPPTSGRQAPGPASVLTPPPDANGYIIEGVPHNQHRSSSFTLT